MRNWRLYWRSYPNSRQKAPQGATFRSKHNETYYRGRNHARRRPGLLVCLVGCCRYRGGDVDYGYFIQGSYNYLGIISIYRLLCLLYKMGAYDKNRRISNDYSILRMYRIMGIVSCN